MAKKHRRLWVLVFAWAVALLALLAIGWNFIVVEDYRKLLELGRTASDSGAPVGEIASPPWGILALGALGFIAALGTMWLVFNRLLSEMKLNQMQAEFLAAVTHELKTPLASIELSASLLRGGHLPEGEAERLWSAHGEELKRLREEVEAILEAARWRARPATVQRAPVFLEDWLASAMRRWERILGPGAKLERKGDPLDGQANLDPRTFSLITDNLIDNARKFSKGSPKVIIATRKLPPSGWATLSKRPRWQIEIRDEGWGFSPQDTKRLFQPFYRSKSKAPYAIPGNGLGLYLAQSASRALGLTLKGHSAGHGSGAVFTLKGRML